MTEIGTVSEPTNKYLREPKETSGKQSIYSNTIDNCDGVKLILVTLSSLIDNIISSIFLRSLGISKDAPETNALIISHTALSKLSE